MSPQSLSDHPAWASAVAEAAAWIAMLHGPSRTSAAERGFQRWLAENPLHQKAFELATDAWNESTPVVQNAARVELVLPDQAHESRSRVWMKPACASAAVAAVLMLFGGLYFFWHEPSVATGVGEQRTRLLEDGSRILMNTATRLSIHYTEGERRIRLKSGEAQFDVAKNPNRPFVVMVSDRKVRALGTAFLVRHDPEKLAVTLLEGRVEVTRAALGGERPGLVSGGAVTLAPGQRLTFRGGGGGSPKIDRPPLKQLTAWQQGKVDLDDLTLLEAIAEMNRYSPVSLEVAEPGLATIRLSGTVRAGDSRSFAKAVAVTHGLLIEDLGNRIVFVRAP
jgi:transmembrane sensor